MNNLGSWIFFMTVFFVFTLTAALIDSAAVPTDGGFVSSLLGFNPQSISSGGGALGAISIGTKFFTTTLPTWVSFNYSFLQDPSTQIFRVALMTIFGGSVVLLLGLSFAGSLIGGVLGRFRR